MDRSMKQGSKKQEINIQPVGGPSVSLVLVNQSFMFQTSISNYWFQIV